MIAAGVLEYKYFLKKLDLQKMLILFVEIKSREKMIKSLEHLKCSINYNNKLEII